MQALLAWGKASSGALGISASELTCVTAPQQIQSLEGKEIVNVSSGENHTLICTKDGCVYSCGSNEFKQCGREKYLTKFERVEEGLSAHHVIHVEAGSSHSVALTQAHEVLTWGKNTEGQLGREASEDTSGIPKLVKSLAVCCVLQVSCGNDHTMVLTNECLVAVWGSNAYGQLGLGRPKNSFLNVPTFITCLKGIPVVQVAAGGNHSFILSKSGAVYGWGRNSFGQLGLNDTQDYDVPKQCRPLRTQRIKYICCGENHTACLTGDGRVFTFGTGTYGQLGHNSNNNEILPKQVIELSGSEVSQIACGRGHTLAYVPKSGRLYAFGLGGSGQLGLSSTENKNSPFAVQGPFSSGVISHSSMLVDNQGPDMVVKSVYAGGDQTFVVLKCVDAGQTDDFRLVAATRQILTLSLGKLEPLRHLHIDENPPVEISDEIIKIFSFASCLNGSFLLPNDEHYGTSSKKHGVDMNAVREFFKNFGELRNIVIKQQMSKTIEQHLIPSLAQAPPDVEALRLYLMLPECHLFDEPKLYSSIICPFAKSFLALNKVPLSVFDNWWPSNQPSFFNRLIVIYKSCIEYLLQLPDTSNQLEVTTRQQGLYYSMEMLKKLNLVNEANHQIIPYHKFYVPELKDKVNIRDDYISWCTVQQSNQRTKGLYFCSYPFLFDGAAKSHLLQTDAALQMQNAIESAYRHNFLEMITGLPTRIFDPVNPCLILTVKRDSLIQDTLAQLQYKHSTEFKKPLKVIFEGEEAVDEGGVRKEFFILLLREVMDPKYGMFKLHEGSNLQWFNPSTFEEANMFQLIGNICGLAIYNFTIIDLHFPQALFKKLLNRPVTLDDIKELDPGVGKSLQDMLDFEGDEFEDVYCLAFEVMQEVFGESKAIELCPDGHNKTVNQSNKHDYINLYVDYILNKSVEVPFRAFYNGFHSVCGGMVLELFQPQELQAMVVGNEDYDFNELEKNTDYKQDYHKYH
ncbi:probable E3 ubiquitin-protein ligase HERC4, partial [Physella acuta]|uniref:probable E3 ubiquitin-protein ligase HERC4 n=1 Tax=Physella acuta TaxID=109671 RepID=UPI0027DC643F